MTTLSDLVRLRKALTDAERVTAFAVRDGCDVAEIRKLIQAEVAAVSIYRKACDAHIDSLALEMAKDEPVTVGVDK